MSHYRTAPSFWWATFAVFIGYVTASLVVTLIAARMLAAGAVAPERVSTSFLTAQIVSLVFGSLIAAGVVYLIVNDGGEGPTFGRVVLALVLGNILRLVVLVVRIRTVQHLHGWQTNPSAPLLFAFSAPLFAPFSFLGLLLSGAVLANPQRKAPAGVTEPAPDG